MTITTEFYNLIPTTDILFLEAYLSWDERVVNDLFSDLQLLTSKFYHNRPWAILTDATKWELSTPEVVKLISNPPILEIQTLTHHAVVTDGSGLKKWLINEMVMKEKKFETRFFQDVRLAENWLIQSESVLYSA